MCYRRVTSDTHGQTEVKRGTRCTYPRGVIYAYHIQATGSPLCGKILSAMGRAGSRGQLLAPAFRRRPVGASPTVFSDSRGGTGAGSWPLHVYAWLTLLTQR